MSGSVKNREASDFLVIATLAFVLIVLGLVAP